MSGMSFVLSVIIVPLAISGIIYKNILLFLFGMVFLAMLLTIRYGFKIVFDKKQISYTGFFSTKTIALSEIIHAGWMFEHGYSRDRFFGSFVYEILSKDNCIRINFRLFSLDSMKEEIKILESLAPQVNNKE